MAPSARFGEFKDQSRRLGIIHGAGGLWLCCGADCNRAAYIYDTWAFNVDTKPSISALVRFSVTATVIHDACCGYHRPSGSPA